MIFFEDIDHQTIIQQHDQSQKMSQTELLLPGISSALFVAFREVLREMVEVPRLVRASDIKERNFASPPVLTPITRLQDSTWGPQHDTEKEVPAVVQGKD